ncbi:polyadenylate-binding protein 2 [Angomonas deanei]|uniref:RNA recognition motif. (A.k.a. RRM, RBD, or RNP domain), putative n=1 Tax=Angomonas deanei TaxID=59799 RepID=A0A7G2CIU6_9TRYP|nr:polyadenylate-binding protein 2 [Angomonas deanei]CAD2219768.1 RNA recognition motif. (a.k.a. RRM, RBD, or RNP domain), putative [Angomonas deanei]|eukprot:EPY34893.1 polyadenylate-binding protein 2 [Angomonas deanei]
MDIDEEIARIQAQIDQDNNQRSQPQQQQQQQQFVGFNQPQQQQQQQYQAPSQGNVGNTSNTPFHVNPQATPYTPPQQQQTAAPYGATEAQPTAHTFSKDSDSRSIFVGNLPKGDNGGPSTTVEELTQFFGDCGNILNCTLRKDRQTGQLTGNAYIEFEKYTSMGKAIDTKDKADFKGNTIIVC